jgi:hypothetical protein
MFDKTYYFSLQYSKDSKIGVLLSGPNEGFVLFQLSLGNLPHLSYPTNCLFRDAY